MGEKALESRCRRFSMTAGRMDIMSSLQGVRNRAFKSSLSPRYGDGSEAGEYCQGVSGARGCESRNRCPGTYLSERGKAHARLRLDNGLLLGRMVPFGRLGHSILFTMAATLLGFMTSDGGPEARVPHSGSMSIRNGLQQNRILGDLVPVNLEWLLVHPSHTHRTGIIWSKDEHL